MASTDQYGLIILGNSGVGKSFLANIITDNEKFLHQFQPTSTTHNTTSVDITLGSHTFTIFDTPGLIEAQQERIDLNKQEIDEAFTQRPNSIILFVFGQVNGRLRGQDIVAFDAINAAYPFKQGSLLLVVNGVPNNRPSDYSDETTAQLGELLIGINANKDNLFFIDFINVNDANQRLGIKNTLLPILTKFTPNLHNNKQNIQTIISLLKISEEDIHNKQLILEQQRKEYEKQLEEQKHIAQKQIAEEQRREAELRETLRRKEEEHAEAERRRAAERAAQEAEAERLRARLIPFYRYGRTAYDHFYTTNANEIGTITPGSVGRHNYMCEGNVGKIYNSTDSQPPLTMPFYRYCNTKNAQHFYTTNGQEIRTIVAGTVVGNWKCEGIAGYIYSTSQPNTAPLYRYYASRHDAHFYTTNANEIGTTTSGAIGNYGYKFEGIAGYVVTTSSG